MANRKQEKPLKPRKKTTVANAYDQDTQAQQQFIEYHSLAQQLHEVNDKAGAEQLLSSFNSLPAASQLTVIKALAKEKNTEAADLLFAINLCSPVKEARKEAKRVLLHLESAKIFPDWKPVEEQHAQPLPKELLWEDISTRFWKGFASNAKDSGEVQLLLFWEQGPHYRDARMLGFLLDYNNAGVKDFFTEVRTRLHMDEHINYMRLQYVDIELKPCSLAEGRRLLQDALAVNARENTEPHKDFLKYEDIINHLVLQAEPEEAVEPEETETDEVISSSALPDLPGQPEDVVLAFLDAWLNEDYSRAYAQLASESPLRQGLSVEEWTLRRQDWQKRFQPEQPLLDVVYQAINEGKLLDETEMSGEQTRETLAYWSLIFANNLYEPSLPELPLPSISYKETGRYWFSCSYTIVKENEAWRVLAMTDQVDHLSHLSTAELQEEMEEIGTEAAELLRERVTNFLKESEASSEAVSDEDEEPDEEDFLEDLIINRRISWLTHRGLLCDDMLLQRLPEQEDYYQVAYQQAMSLQDPERAAAYAELLAKNIPQKRAEGLRKLVEALMNVIEELDDDEEGEKLSDHLTTLSEQSLQESIALEEHAQSYLFLAALLIDRDNNFTDAQAILEKALTISPTSQEEAQIYVRLSQIASTNKHDDVAIKHLQHAVEIEPEMAIAWFSLGNAQLRQGMFEEAKESFRQGIEIDPDESSAYVALASLFIPADLDQAEEILEEGLEINEEAADILAELAVVAVYRRDFEDALELLEEAEDIDDEHTVVQHARALYEQEYSKHRQSVKAKHGKAKKR